MWHNGEVNAYPAQDFGKPNPDMSNFEAWGHFSQLVWVGSEQVGCVTQYCDAGTIYPDFASYFTVCNYFPAGKLSFSVTGHDEMLTSDCRQYGWRLWTERSPSPQ